MIIDIYCITFVELNLLRYLYSQLYSSCVFWWKF